MPYLLIKISLHDACDLINRRWRYDRARKVWPIEIHNLIGKVPMGERISILCSENKFFRTMMNTKS